MVLAMLSYWIEYYVQAPKPAKSKSVKLHHPDYFMEHFITSKTDKQGRLKSMLAATKLEHYVDDDSIHISSPQFSQFAANGVVNTIQAKRGVISAEGEVAEFYDEVVVSRPANESKPIMKLYTNYLRLVPNQNLATTPEYVRITQGEHSYMTGTGMVYNRDTGDLTLENKVKIHYAKEHDQTALRVEQPAAPAVEKTSKPLKPLHKTKPHGLSGLKPRS